MPPHCSWGALPRELQQRIADLLDVRTRLALRRVNRAANQLVITRLPIANVLCVGVDPATDASLDSLLCHPTCRPTRFGIEANGWYNIARCTLQVAKGGQLRELWARTQGLAYDRITPMPPPIDIIGLVERLTNLRQLALDFTNSELWGSAMCHYHLEVLAHLPHLRALTFKASAWHHLRPRAQLTLPPLAVRSLELGNADVEAPWSRMSALRHLVMDDVAMWRQQFAVPSALTTVVFTTRQDEYGRAERGPDGWGLIGTAWFDNVTLLSTLETEHIFDIEWLAPIYADTVSVTTMAYIMNLIAARHATDMVRVMPRLNTACFVLNEQQQSISYAAVAALQKENIRVAMSCGTLLQRRRQ